MAREKVDVKDVLQRCQEIFALRAEEKGIQLKAAIDTLPPVTGDADRLEDVFCNLLDNALKNTPAQGEVQIAARTARQQHRNQCRGQRPWYSAGAAAIRVQPFSRVQRAEDRFRAGAGHRPRDRAGPRRQD